MPSKFVTLLHRLAGLERPDRWVDPSHADWAAGLEAGRVSSLSGDGGGRVGTTELESARATDPPERTRGRASPARIKLRVENERTLEIKIVYRLGGPERGKGRTGGGWLWRRAEPAQVPRANTYRVDVYLFCPSELEPADPTSSFYANLFVVIRLHTPHVELADLAAAGAALDGGVGSGLARKGSSVLANATPSSSLAVATSLLTALARSFGDMHASASAAASARARAASLGWADPRHRIAVKAAEAAEKARAARADDAVQLMRLLACIFRAAVRRATGVAADAALAVAAGAREDEDNPLPDAAKAAAARAGIDLVEQACGALEALATACDPCRADATGALPAFVREAAGLVEEHTILEAERALLKLLCDLEPDRPPAMAAAAAAAGGGGGGGGGGPEASQLFMRVPGLDASTLAPPPPPPRPAPAGWAGRFPHLDAVRESAAAARRRTTGGGSVRGAGSTTTTTAWTPAARSVDGGDSRTSAYSGAGGTATPLAGTSPPQDTPRRRRETAPVPVPPATATARLARHSAGSTTGSRSPPPGWPAASSLGRRPSLEMLVSPPTALGGPLSSPGGGGGRTIQPPPSPGGGGGHATQPKSPRDRTASVTQPQTPAAVEDLESARALLREAVAGLEAARLRRGYTESLMRDGPPEVNELYTNRRQVLKKHARAAISLTPITKAPPTLLQDLVGMAVAAVAMAFATWTVILAQRYAGEQYGALYILILVFGYVIKDRLKELGKRYLQPAASFFGVVFHDRIVNAEDGRGETVGTVAERVRLLEPEALNPRVRALRNYGASLGAHARAAAQPERVLAYSKETTVAWSRLDARLQGVGALSDIMRFDLGPLTRRMQAPIEPHLRLARAAADAAPEHVPCARVYHVNCVLRVRAAAPAAAGGAGAPPQHHHHPPPAVMVMLLERARVVMNRDGILRLEAAAGSLLRERERGTAARSAAAAEAGGGLVGGGGGGGGVSGGNGRGVLNASIYRARRAVGWVLGRGGG